MIAFFLNRLKALNLRLNFCQSRMELILDELRLLGLSVS